MRYSLGSSYIFLRRSHSHTPWQHPELNRGSKSLMGGSAPAPWPFHSLVQNITITSLKEEYFGQNQTLPYDKLEAFFFMCLCIHESPALIQAGWCKGSRPGFGLVLLLFFHTGLFQIIALFYPPWFINSVGISSAKSILTLTQTNSMGFQWC